MKRPRFRKAGAVRKSFVPVMPEMLPGIRGSAEWHVRPTELGETPHTLNHSGGKSELAIPTEGKPDQDLVRIHEMLHAAHSPVEAPRPVEFEDEMLEVMPLLIAEEIRINTMLRRTTGADWSEANLDHDQIKNTVDFWASEVRPATPKELLIYHLCLWPLSKNFYAGSSPVTARLSSLAERNKLSPAHKKYLKDLQTNLLRVSQWILHSYYNDFKVPTWTVSTLPAAKYLQQIFRNLDKANEEKATASQELQELIEQNPDMEKMLEAAMEEYGDSENPFEPYTPEVRRSEQDIEWGEMRIIVADMPIRLPNKFRMKDRYRSTDMGVVPRHIHRSLIDGQVFTTKRSEPAGSVLIDHSGSMSLSSNNIRQIVETAPGTIIATYAGGHSEGALHIIAEDGQRADERTMSKSLGGGNLVDMPALEWLAEQPKPRIWVSDGYVVPKKGDMGLAMQICAKFAIDNDINLVANDGEALEVFVGKREYYR